MSTAKPSTSNEYRIEAPRGLELDTGAYLELHDYMRLNRSLDEKLSVLYRQGLVVGGLYSSLGQEATSVGSAFALEEGDYFSPMIRNVGSCLVRGVRPTEVISQYLARVSGPSEGREANIHFGDLDRGMVACISMLGALIPVMAGVALVMKQKKMENIALTYIGDGGTSTTDFHEGLNFAAVQRVPFVLIVENNLYAYSTPVSQQTPTKDIAEKARAYGIHGEVVDGNNVLAVLEATRRARRACLEGKGPVMIECKTFRRKGHAEHDDARYVPKKLLLEWEAKDPLTAYESFLVREGIASETTLEESRNRITSEIERAVETAVNSAFPDPRTAVQSAYSSDATTGGRR